MNFFVARECAFVRLPVTSSPLRPIVRPDPDAERGLLRVRRYADPDAIAGRPGRASAAMTLTTDAHLMSGSDDRARRVPDGVFDGARESPATSTGARTRQNTMVTGGTL